MSSSTVPCRSARLAEKKRKEAFDAKVEAYNLALITSRSSDPFRSVSCPSPRRSARLAVKNSQVEISVKEGEVKEGDVVVELSDGEEVMVEVVDNQEVVIDLAENEEVVVEQGPNGEEVIIIQTVAPVAPVTPVAAPPPVPKPKPTLADLNALKEKAANTFAECWVLYSIKSFNRCRRYGIQGTEFHMIEGSERDTELEARQSATRKDVTYIMIPALKNGLGELWTFDKGEKLLKAIASYNGYCKVLLEQHDPTGFYKNPNQQRWIMGNKVERGIACFPAYIHSIEKRPSDWIEYQIHLDQMRVLWKAD
jgi:hypothetical protein